MPTTPSSSRVARYMYGTYFDHVFGAEVFTDLFLQLQAHFNTGPRRPSSMACSSKVKFMMCSA